MNLFASCFMKSKAFVTSLVRRPQVQPPPGSPASNDQPMLTRSLTFSVPTTPPSATIGPCLTCHCDHVNVTLLTSHVRYCRCPGCGSAWTEPTKWQHVAHPDSFQSEPLKFLRDRN
jgi:hypothetical protein